MINITCIDYKLFNILTGIPVSYRDVESIDPEYASNLQVSVCMYVCIYMYVSTWCMCLCMYMYVYVSMYMYVCMYLCV